MDELFALTSKLKRLKEFILKESRQSMAGLILVDLYLRRKVDDLGHIT
jgi:hypothetical protein